MNAAAMKQSEFRALFPALERYAWFDTPGCPPGARPVTEALQDAIADWSAGDFSWLDWDAAGRRARGMLAALLGVAADDIALMGSLAEAASTVARSLPPGRVVVPQQEFRSNLLPWTSLDPDRNPVVLVPPRDGLLRTEDVVAALAPGTAVLAVSTVLTSDGVRVDLPALRAATDAVGARLFVDATQSLGILDVDFPRLRPDYLAAHGYKSMLCPRGAAWLVARPDRHSELTPLLPGWKSTPPPHGYFGPVDDLAHGAARCDTSPSWFSWIGAVAALGIHLRLDVRVVEQHCLGLIAHLHDGASELGLRPITPRGSSHVLVLEAEDCPRLDAVLRNAGVRAAVAGNRLRLGVHYFNDETDLDRLLAVLSTIREAVA